MTEKLGNICSNVLNNIKVKKENETMDREKIIELVKALGITAEELGIEPKIETVRDTELIEQMRKVIEHFTTPEDARDYINEKYWDDLGIRPKKKYKVVECRLEKKIYKSILVAMPEEDDDSNVEDYYDYYYVDNDDYDDEDEWEIDYTNNHETDLTAEQLRKCYSDDVINYHDFDE